MKAALLLFAIVLAAVSLGCAAEASDQAAITVRYSRFSPGVVSVPSGVPVSILLRNDDPIEHEWIVGTEQVHEAHRMGTEPYHDTRPTEVTLPAFSKRTTVVVFQEAGEYAFICHLPGHEAYGMKGVLRVVSR
jgi:uncharacterized cupredoxin-like copper-binding protein